MNHDVCMAFFDSYWYRHNIDIESAHLLSCTCSYWVRVTGLSAATLFCEISSLMELP